MRIWKQPLFALAVALVLAAGGTLFSAHRSLSAMAARVEGIYRSGTEGDGLCIASDLDARLADSWNLVTVARRYLPEEGEIAGVLAARDALQAAEGPAAQAAANGKLTEAVTALYTAMADAPLTDGDETYRRGLYADLEARNRTIGHDGYNSAAAEFNALLTQFPTGLLARAVGVSPAEYFR